MLRAKSRYPQLCSDPVSMATDVTDTLQLFTPAYYSAFSERYAGKSINHLNSQTVIQVVVQKMELLCTILESGTPLWLSWL